MKLHQLRALMAVAEKGSTHEASRKLNLSQPAVSKAVSDLEQELGVLLLIRSVQGAQLTAYGRSLIRHARAVEQALRHAREDIDAMLDIARGTITLGVTAVTALGPLSHALVRFKDRHPQVNVNVLELRPSQILDGLMDGALDLGLLSRIGDFQDARFEWEPLVTLPTSLAVRTGHPLRGRQTLESLSELQWLSWDGHDDAAGFMGRIFAERGLPSPKDIVRCTATMLYVELATSTDRISFWSSLPFHTPILEGRIRPIELTEPLDAMAIGLVHRGPQFVTSAAETFMMMVRSAFTELPELYRQAGVRSLNQVGGISVHTGSR